MNNIIALLLTGLATFCGAALFRTRFRLVKLSVTRRTYALAAIWFLFGAGLMLQGHRTDFTSPIAYGRLQQSRRIAAALSILAICSYAWDMQRNGAAQSKIGTA
jgi:hypothetical protein